MTPAPMTTIFLGTFGRLSAPSEVTTTFSSISIPGSAEGSDPLATTIALASCTSSPTLTRPASGDRSPTLQPVDLVLLEQEFDAFGVLADDVVLVGLHLFPVDRRRLALQPHLGEVVLGLVQLVGGMQQRLGRDAADVQAGPAERLAPLHAGCLEAQLRASDGTDIAPRAGADDDDVVTCHGIGPFCLGWKPGALPPDPRRYLWKDEDHRSAAISIRKVAIQPTPQTTLRHGTRP